MRYLRTTLAAAFAAALLGAEGAAQLITEFPLPAGSLPTDIAAGPGGMWFTLEGASRIGRITAGGEVTEFPVSRPAHSIVGGADGNVWFASRGYVSRMTPDGVVTDFPVPGSPYDVAVGPDRAIWFTTYTAERGPQLCRLGGDGTVTSLPLASPGYGIAVGADGNFWLTNWDDFGFDEILRVTPSGTITKWSVWGSPSDIVWGPDGNVWVAMANGRQILRITPAGEMRGFEVAQPLRLTVGLDGYLWFTTYDNRVGRMTTHGSIATFPVPTPDAGVLDIAAGPDGAVWFTERKAGRIGRVALHDSAALALHGGRYRVELTWSSGADAGPGRPVALSDSSGYFWFHEPGNVEVVVKLLDWCPDDLLFFAGGLTSFASSLTVTDNLTGFSRTWNHPGGPFPSIQESFGACPVRAGRGR